MKMRTWLKRRLVPKALDRQLDAIEKPVGSMGFDPWGFNKDSNKIAISLMSPIFKRYFRVASHGIERVPDSGPVLLVGNHSGQLPIDGMLVSYAVATRAKAPRMPRAMIERFFGTVPYLGNLINQVGGVLGDPVNCATMLANGEAVIVFPEGVRGSGKAWQKRYQLQRFGSGFMHLAMQHAAPIVPVAVVGCEETIPSLANIAPLARLLGLPYVPVCLPAVLPARVSLHFGEPMVFDDIGASDREINRRVESVKNAIRELIADGLAQRTSVFL